jgi:hypothetical protein
LQTWLAGLRVMLAEMPVMGTQIPWHPLGSLRQALEAAVVEGQMAQAQDQGALEDFPLLEVVQEAHVGLQQAHLVQEAQALLAWQSSQPTFNVIPFQAPPNDS